MNNVLSIKDKEELFSIEVGRRNLMFPSLSLTVNKVKSVSLIDMVDKIIEHIDRVFELNKGRVNRFCVNTGFEMNLYVNITINNYESLKAMKSYALALFYVIFMIAYIVDENMTITEEEMSKFKEVKESIKEGELITGG